VADDSVDEAALTIDMILMLIQALILWLLCWVFCFITDIFPVGTQIFLRDYLKLPNLVCLYFINSECNLISCYFINTSEDLLAILF
jgi:hypothetical protein